jgi:hypothetical protein
LTVSEESGRIIAQITSNYWLLALSKAIVVAESPRITTFAIIRALLIVSIEVG